MTKSSRSRRSGSTPPASVLERRQRIIDTTRELVAEMGVEGVSMRDLAARSKVAVATLYNQFGSREAILADALKHDFDGRYEPFSSDVHPAQRVEQRISYAAKEIAGPMRDYTRSVMFFYFHTKPDSTLRATMHDPVVRDFTRITEAIAERGELQSWVKPKQFADDLITQLYSLVVKWSQGYIPARKLSQRLMLTAVTAYIGISSGKTRREFEALAAKYA